MDEHQFDEEYGSQGTLLTEPLVDRYRTCGSDDLASLYAELGGGARALEAQRLAIVAVLDERDAWQVDGARDMTGWIAGTDALHRRTAKGLVEVARALVDLPAIARVAAEGRLSFDQLRPLCALATEETDTHWATHGSSLEPGQLAAEAAKATRKQREKGQEEEGKRILTIWKARGGGTRFAGYLPDVDAELLAAGLDRLALRYRPAPGKEWDPLQQRRADALVELASMSIAETAVGATAHLYIHAHAHAGGPGWRWVGHPRRRDAHRPSHPRAPRVRRHRPAPPA